MSSQRQFVIWVLAALVALALLAGVLVRQHRTARVRWNAFVVGNPHRGVELFETKGCIQCHAVNGWGRQSAPDLGLERPPRSSLNQLVAAMWNCAPRMWERMRAERMPFPVLDQEDMAHLFAFLYTARYVDEPGDAGRGARLFESKGCIQCHRVRGSGGTIGPDLATSGGDTPIVWTQAMWNHAPSMETRMKQFGVAWPKFQGHEMNDLLAYVREVSAGPRRESALLPADPNHGARLFRTKSCIYCHAIRAGGEHVGPELGPPRQLPPTLVQFAGLMWNHSPQMWRAMQAKGIERPTFEVREMADLIAFLYTLRYFEPRGSPEEGQRLFADRKCNQCHGANGEGAKDGPALRKHGETFSSIDLATALWRHGPKMYERVQERGLSWPNLAEGDVGNLVSFLNAPAGEIR